MSNLSDIQSKLFSLADVEYKDFHSRLIPNVNVERIIGVRTPRLRQYAKELFREGADDFLSALPHGYYEEDNLHAFLIEQIDDYDEVISRLDAFLPYVDNWATCDMMSPKCFSKNRDRLYKDAYRWMEAEHPYCVRYGICMMMKHYLGNNFKTEFLEKVASVRSDEYYVKMGVAWYFATALTCNYNEVLPYVQSGALEQWTHNKAIAKACESLVLPADRKAELKTYRKISEKKWKK